MMNLDFIHTSPFYEIAALLLLAFCVGFIGFQLGQPVVVSFIAAGMLAGPSVLNIVKFKETLGLLSGLGATILSFLIGLKLNFQLLRTLGIAALVTGLGQLILTSLAGFFIGAAIGLDNITALYVAAALTFSSTIIVAKLLSDKGEVESTYGQLSIGYLVIQDVAVVLLMVVLSSMNTNLSQVLATNSVNYIFCGAALLILLPMFVYRLSGLIMHKLGSSDEMLLTFAVGWSCFLAAFASYFGFSKELGAMLAGLALASTPLAKPVLAIISPVRDFLLIFFFVALGAQFNLSMTGAQTLPVALFSIFVLIGNPVIVILLMKALGYDMKTAFLTGMTSGQISEFSFVFMNMGLSLGHVPAEAVRLVTLVGLITISLSVYMITYSELIYSKLEKWIGRM